jgi:hypothetical protein
MKRVHRLLIVLLAIVVTGQTAFGQSPGTGASCAKTGPLAKILGDSDE